MRTEGVRFGTVSGMAPGARIAAYKVCFNDRDEDSGDCFTSSILEAIDDAVSDGVDVINMSISGAADTVVDPVEIAFEGAAEAGIFVATSAGNSGPEVSTVAHNSPWLTTVAATTHVNLENTVVLGNGRGSGAPRSPRRPLPQTRLISPPRRPPPETTSRPRPCASSAARSTRTRSRARSWSASAAINDRVDKSKAVKKAGGVGMVLANVTPGSLNADFHSVPTIHISDHDARKVFRYVDRRGRRATAALRLGDGTGKQPTPVPQIAGFSSRGPALANDGDLLKPDIAAPGVSVLAAVAPPVQRGPELRPLLRHVDGLAAHRRHRRPHHGGAHRLDADAGQVGDDDHRHASPRRAQRQGQGPVRPGRRPRGRAPSAFDPGLFVTSGTVDWRGFLAGQGLPTGYEPVAAQGPQRPVAGPGAGDSETSFTRDLTADRAGTWKVSVELQGFADRSPRAGRPRGKGDRIKLRLDLRADQRRRSDDGRPVTSSSTGPTRLRLPIAVRPVSVRAPAEVEGTGTTGAVDVPVTAGFTGNLAVEVTGLAKAQSFAGTSADIRASADDSQFFCVQVAAGSGWRASSSTPPTTPPTWTSTSTPPTTRPASR